MNARQRVLAALMRQPVDRIPIDFCGHNDSCIHEIAYQRLLAHLKLPPETPAYANPLECVVYASEEILQLSQADTRAVFLPVENSTGTLQPDGGRLLTSWDGSTWRKPAGGYYFDLYIPPLRGGLSSKAIATIPWPTVSMQGLKTLRERAKRLHEETTYAVVMSGFLIMPASGPQLWRGMEQWSIDTLAETTLWLEMTEAYMARVSSLADQILKAVGDYIDVAYIIGDDLASQKGPWVRPSFYRQMIKPFQKRAVEFIRDRTKAKLVFHICGSAREFIPDLIDIGVDAINPVQTTAHGMDPNDLKREFGNNLAFWGGIDTQHVLPSGTPAEVEREVKRIIDSLGPSGLVLASCHNIQPDVPPENTLAMFQAAARLAAHSRGEMFPTTTSLSPNGSAETTLT